MTRFSQIYLRPTVLSADSVRMRVRLGALARDTLHYSLHDQCSEYLEFRLGVRSWNWRRLFDEPSLRDVLDAITAILDFLVKRYETAESYNKRERADDVRTWVSGVKTILQEECVSYRIDKDCVVHFAVDDEFDRNRTATLSGLGSPRYGSARRDFEEAFRALRGDPPNSKAAIRGVFIAAETVFKLMFDRASKLSGNEVRTLLKPVVARTYAPNRTERTAMEKSTDSFMQWVEAAHFYRHAQGEEEPTEPPLETTVLLVSQGSAFLRWLMTVDAAEMARADGAK